MQVGTSLQHPPAGTSIQRQAAARAAVEPGQLSTPEGRLPAAQCGAYWEFKQREAHVISREAAKANYQALKTERR